MMKLFKFIAAFLSAFTMCFSPLAQALEKSDQMKEAVNEYLKSVGITTKKQTVSEYWRQVRHGYPSPFRNKMDLFIAKTRDQMMPVAEAVGYKDGQGREQVRVTFSMDGETLTATLIGDEAQFLKINGVSFSRKEISDPEAMIRKVLASDAKLNKKILASPRLPILRKNLVMSAEELRKLTPLQQAEYFVRLRSTMMAAQEVFKNVYGKAALEQYNKKYEWVQSFLLGEEAQAADSPLTGKTCVVAGYLSVYGEKGSCGGPGQGAADLNKQMNSYQASCSEPNQIPCNPLVYGFKSGSTAYCVEHTRSVIIDATANCNKQSPFNGPNDIENKKRIIESFVNRNGKKIDLKFNEEGKVSPEQLAEVKEYLDGLNKLIGDAKMLCDGPDFQKIKGQRPDQGKACSALLSRAFDLQSFSTKPVPAPIPEPPPPPAPLPVAKCSEKPGSVPAADGSCVCDAGTIERGGEEGGGSCEVVVTPPPPIAPQKKDDCGLMCNGGGLLLGIGLIAAIGLGIWWFTKDSGTKKPPVYTPPAGGLPPVSICDPPMVMVGRVCSYTPPVVVDPSPVVVPSETGVVTDGRSGGGVRRGAQ